MPRLLRVLLPLAAAAAAVLTTCEPAFAAWTTLAGTDPVVQVDHVCHDGADVDMGRWQVRDARVPSITPAAAARYQRQHPLVAQVVEPVTLPAADPGWQQISRQSVLLPLDPQVIDEGSTDDAGHGTEHVLVGQVHFSYAEQPTDSHPRLIIAGSDPGTDYIPLPVADCFLRVGTEQVGVLGRTTSVAVLGNTALDVRTVTPSGFRVRAVSPPSHILFPPAPVNSRITDVDGDGIDDLVLTVWSAGSGITSATTAATLTGSTATGGSIAGTVALGTAN